MLRQPNVLLLCSDETQSFALREILSEHAVLTPAGNLDEMKAHLESSFYDAAFCAWSFHLGTWPDALLEVQRLCPDMPVIIFSSTAGNQEWVRCWKRAVLTFCRRPIWNIPCCRRWSKRWPPMLRASPDASTNNRKREDLPGILRMARAAARPDPWMEVPGKAVV
jgi:DNA-binding NtrC family response regulator